MNSHQSHKAVLDHQYEKSADKDAAYGRTRHNETCDGERRESAPETHPVGEKKSLYYSDEGSDSGVCPQAGRGAHHTQKRRVTLEKFLVRPDAPYPMAGSLNE
jgi:hypothetical protein